ncbi:tetratricopeptide repeat protein, partial [Chloroflexota bacterium]
MSRSELETLLQEGIAAAKAGQTERARQALMRVVELDEKNTQAWLWLSTVVDDPADKHTYLYNVLELEPGNKHAWIGLTRLEEMAELPPAPETSSTKPATSEPSRSGKYKRLSSKQDGDTFCPFCKQPLSAVAIRCEHCQLPLIIDCPACSVRVDVEQIACPKCDQLMGDFRHKSVYFAQLATAYYERQHYRKAVVMWQVVELLKPNYPQLRIRLAEAYVAAGRLKTAIAALQRELAEYPGQQAASLSLGGILEKWSRWAESETVYREALAVFPDSAELHLALGRILLQRKELKEGLNYVHMATRLDPEHGMAWLRLGQLYEATEQEKQAAEAYRRAAELLPTHKLAQQKAEQLAGVLAPELPVVLATGWSELIRQLAGPILIC